MHLGFGEIVIVAVLAMLLFGPKRVSDLGVALGQSIRGFKKGLAGEEEIKPAGTTAAVATQQQNGGQPPTPPALSTRAAVVARWTLCRPRVGQGLVSAPGVGWSAPSRFASS